MALASEPQSLSASRAVKADVVELRRSAGDSRRHGPKSIRLVIIITRLPRSDLMFKQITHAPATARLSGEMAAWKGKVYRFLATDTYCQDGAQELSSVVCSLFIS